MKGANLQRRSRLRRKPAQSGPPAGEHLTHHPEPGNVPNVCIKQRQIHWPHKHCRRHCHLTGRLRPIEDGRQVSTREAYLRAAVIDKPAADLPDLSKLANGPGLCSHQAGTIKPAADPDVSDAARHVDMHVFVLAADHSLTVFKH